MHCPNALDLKIAGSRVGAHETLVYIVDIRGKGRFESLSIGFEPGDSAG